MWQRKARKKIWNWKCGLMVSLSFLFRWSCDFVELTVSTGRLARLSGSRNGFSITVRGDRSPVLNIRFTTDRSFVRQGFFARYIIIFGEKTVNSWSSYTWLRLLVRIFVHYHNRSQALVVLGKHDFPYMSITIKRITPSEAYGLYTLWDTEVSETSF